MKENMCQITPHVYTFLEMIGKWPELVLKKYYSRTAVSIGPFWNIKMYKNGLKPISQNWNWHENKIYKLIALLLFKIISKNAKNSKNA